MSLIPEPPDEFEEGSGWQRFQPSWPAVLLASFGLAAVFGLLSFLETGAPEVLGVAAIGGLLICVFLRWIYPMYRHLWWGDDD